MLLCTSLCTLEINEYETDYVCMLYVYLRLQQHAVDTAFTLD